jgi:hypothetical protein
MVTISVKQTAADIEALQMQEHGLILRFADYPETATLTTKDDDITIVTADGEEFAGCYVYQTSALAAFIGVS